MYGLDILVLIFYIATLYIDRRVELLKSIAKTLFIICFMYLAHFALSTSKWESIEFWFSVLDYCIYSAEDCYYWLSPLVTLLILARNSLWCAGRLYKQLVVLKSEEVTTKQEYQEKYQEKLYILQCSLNDTRLTLENERMVFKREKTRASQQLTHCRAEVYNLRDQVERLRKSNTGALDKGMLRDMLVLCHPDKHRNSQLATRVTSLLNTMRN